MTATTANTTKDPKAVEADIHAMPTTTKPAWQLRAGDVTEFGTVRSVSPIGTSLRLVQFADLSTKRMRSGTQVVVR